MRDVGGRLQRALAQIFFHRFNLSAAVRPQCENVETRVEVIGRECVFEVIMNARGILLSISRIAHRRARLPGALASALALSLVLGTGGDALARTKVATGARAAAARNDATIVGRVTSFGKPKAFANVVLLSLRRGTMTGEDGRFRIEHLPIGNHIMVASQIGCARETVAVYLAPGSVNILTIELDCPYDATKSGLPPHFLPNESEHDRLGMRCRVHTQVRLASDTVKIHYGFVGAGAVDPDSFPNARDIWDAGCMDTGHKFTEVAYCSECRRAYERWLKRHGGNRVD